MPKPIFLLLSLWILSSCSRTTYYIVRHVEKETATNMGNDVPLSTAGKLRAQALADSLPSNIYTIYSTNFMRTRSTIEPYMNQNGIPLSTLHLYGSDSLHYYIQNWRKTIVTNIIIVGHSNTVDDIVNGLMEKKILNDLPDSRYSDLFIVKKKGKKYRFENKHFGK